MDIIEAAKKITSENREENYENNFRKVNFFN